MKLCLCTNNRGKIEELKDLLPSNWEIVGLNDIGCTDDIAETGKTFEENALLKARYVYDKYGIASLADDSGLCVDALQGAPGVFSARYSGVHGNDMANINLLLTQLQSETNRRAYFTCILAFIATNVTQTFEGRVYGEIASQPSGDQGFGYDPIFIPHGFDQSFGILGSKVKHTMSHRSKAVAQFVTFLQKYSCS